MEKRRNKLKRPLRAFLSLLPILSQLQWVLYFCNLTSFFVIGNIHCFSRTRKHRIRILTSIHLHLFSQIQILSRLENGRPVAVAACITSDQEDELLSHLESGVIFQVDKCPLGFVRGTLTFEERQEQCAASSPLLTFRTVRPAPQGEYHCGEVANFFANYGYPVLLVRPPTAAKPYETTIEFVESSSQEVLDIMPDTIDINGFQG